jgi:hypothetical protein
MGGSEWTTERGRLSLWSAAPLLIMQFSGHGEGEFATPLLTRFDALTDSFGPIHIFFDLSALENYDSALRTRVTQHFQREVERIGSLHVCARSKIVAMGVAVVNLALGGIITSHRERSELLAVIDVLTKQTRVGDSWIRALRADR